MICAYAIIHCLEIKVILHQIFNNILCCLQDFIYNIFYQVFWKQHFIGLKFILHYVQKNISTKKMCTPYNDLKSSQILKFNSMWLLLYFISRILLLFLYLFFINRWFIYLVMMCEQKVISFLCFSLRLDLGIDSPENTNTWLWFIF